jgi:hypothetical protein
MQTPPSPNVPSSSAETYSLTILFSLFLSLSRLPSLVYKPTFTLELSVEKSRPVLCRGKESGAQATPHFWISMYITEPGRPIIFPNLLLD